VVGDDGGGLLHDRDPVGVGRPGDEDRPFDEAVDVLRVLDQADAARDGGVADREALQEFLAAPADL
jgi:hypothetical protein